MIKNENVQGKHNLIEHGKRIIKQAKELLFDEKEKALSLISEAIKITKTLNLLKG